MREDYRKALAGPFSAELQRMRDLVQAGRVIEDPEAWARVTSEELLALKGVQDRMSQDLLAEPIQALADGMARLQQGDLSIQLPVHSFDETGRMTETFNAVSAHLNELVRTLQSQTARVANTAPELAITTRDLVSVAQSLKSSAAAFRVE